MDRFGRALAVAGAAVGSLVGGCAADGPMPKVGRQAVVTTVPAASSETTAVTATASIVDRCRRDCVMWLRADGSTLSISDHRELVVAGEVLLTTRLDFDVERIVHVGPGDVAYLETVRESEDGWPEGDVRAVSLASGDLGRIVGYWQGAGDVMGHAELSPTPAGLVVASFLAMPDVYPPPGEPVVPWIDERGDSTRLDLGGVEYRVADAEFVREGRSWKFGEGERWRLWSGPLLTPFGNGFIAAVALFDDDAGQLEFRVVTGSVSDSDESVVDVRRSPGQIVSIAADGRVLVRAEDGYEIVLASSLPEA